MAGARPQIASRLRTRGEALLFAWILRLFGGARRGVVIVLAVALVVVVGYIDYLAGWETSLAPFYLVPIALAAWVGGRATALAFAAFCGVAWYGIDLASGHSYSSPMLAYWNAAMQLGLFLIVATTLTSLRRSYDREKASARVDPLTGIPNRRSFEEWAALEIQRSARYNRPLTLAYLDVDDFKAVNDRFGHVAGDGVLQLVAEVIRTNLRATDGAARLGGDEFVVLLPETGPDDARAVVTKLLADLKLRAGGGLAPVTISTGVATFLRPPDSPRHLIEKADALMYLVKREGKNGARFGAFGEEGANR